MIIRRHFSEKERRDFQCLASEPLSFSTVNRRFSDWAWRNLLLLGAVVGWLGAAGVGQGATPEVLVREEALRVIDTVELFRNGLYWWTSSACSETPNSGGAAYLAFSDPRRINATLSGHQFFQGYLGGFRPGDLFEPGLPLDTKISGLKGVLPPDCGYGAHFVRDDEAFYYAHGRALFRKPLNALIATAGEPIMFEVGLNRFPVTSDGVLFVTDTELWSYAADPVANTLALQRTGKRGRTEVRDVLVLPGVSIRKFTLVDIQGTDGSYSGSELILLTPDGDPLLFTTQFSPEGETWQTLGVNLPENALAVSTAMLPGGTAAAQVRVLATDGLDTAIAASPTFVLAKHPPEAQVTGVADGQRFDFGSVVTVEGFGYDAEDGSLAAEALRWVLQGPETRDSSGGRLILANLAPGAYTLTLTATDGDGLTATQTLSFAIRPLAVADGAEPVLDGLCADPGYGSTPPARFAAAAGSHAQVRFTHAGSALFVCFMGLSYGAPNTPGAVAGLRVNPSGSSQPVVTTVGFAVNEHGEPLRLGGDGSKFVALTNPPPGFAAVILRDAQAWSAEMRIDDSLLGGWNSALGLVVYVDPGNSVAPQLTWPPNASLANPSSWATAQSAPGRLIYGQQEGNRIAKIFSARADGSDETYITEGARPELSPDGRFLAFVRGGDYTTWLDNDLFVRDLESGVETQIGSNSFEHLLLYDWTADSQTLFADYANTLYRARRNGTDLTPLPFVHEADDAPTVNPVDGRLAFQSPGGLVLEQQDRSGRTPVPNTAPGARWPEWAPDGQWLSYSDGTNVWKIRPDGADQVKLTAFGGADRLEGFTSPWTHDTRAVLVVATLNGARGLYAVAADGSGAANQVPVASGLPLYWVSRRPPPLVTPSGAAVRIVESSLTPTGFSLRCDAPTGVLLQLERTATPSEPQWEAVGDVVVQSSPATWLRDPTAVGRAQGYYRVRVLGGP